MKLFNLQLVIKNDTVSSTYIVIAGGDTLRVYGRRKCLHFMTTTAVTIENNCPTVVFISK